MTAKHTVSLSEVLRVVEEWDTRIDNIQQNDMPGFVRNYTPELVEKLKFLPVEDSLSRVKTAMHRLADRVAIDDENTVRVPLDEILMYTPENRANIARMLRREADAL